MVDVWIKNVQRPRRRSSRMGSHL
uniref:Uncharacterized protein n=1 Tax=Arundo donax TaxID=35708 RepID=A0A0A9EMR4_ARUDO